MILCLRRICLDLSLYILVCPSNGRLTITIYTIVGIGFGYFGIPSKKFCSHFASSPHFSNAMNLDSIVDLAITVYLDDFYEIAALVLVQWDI